MVRLHLYLAQCGIDSRRKCEDIISAGKVTVNNCPVRHSQLIEPGRDTVTVNNRIVALAPKIYYAFHKPINVICSSSRQGTAPIVLDYIKLYKKMHLFTVGRLDKLTSGLIIVSNDGEFSAKVLRPCYKIEKEYIVIAHDVIPIKKINEFTTHSKHTHPYSIKRYQPIAKKCIRIIVTEGKNHEIRNIFKYCRCRIASLIRIRIDKITLGDLKVGAYRELSVQERTHITQAPTPSH